MPLSAVRVENSGLAACANGSNCCSTLHPNSAQRQAVDSGQKASRYSRKIDDGTLLLKHLGEKGFDVAVGFWALTTDDARWILYITSPEVDRLGLAKAFRVVNIELARSNCHWIQRSDRCQAH